MIKKKTHYFLLLEIIIALLLISCSILPFSSYPYKVFQKEISYLEKMAIEPYFSLSFLEALEKNNPSQYTLPSLSVPFGNTETLFIQRFVNIQETYNKEKSPHAMLTITMTLKTKNCSQTKEKIFFISNKKKHNEM